MGKNILGKQIIVCAKEALQKQCENETIVYAEFYSLGSNFQESFEQFGGLGLSSRYFLIY